MRVEPNIIKGHIETRISQTQARHKELGQSLNAVLMARNNLQMQAWTHLVLFNSELTLAYDKLSD